MQRISIRPRSILSTHLVTVSLLASVLAAQDASGGLAAAPRTTAPGRAVGTDEADAAAWRVPIHTQADDPVFGRYGWWAAGRDYKVSFHDGFVFYPYLGPAYEEHLPLRWTTLAVTAGGVPIANLRAPQQAHGDWRFEYRHAGVTEAYDVRDDGVEQTFVIAERPAHGGDLVVEGRVQTRLVPARPVLAAQHGELLFADAAGKPIVRYGAAIAFDARGARTPVTTSLEGDIVRLTVPGAWLAQAVYPVTIDPLTSRVEMNIDTTGGVNSPALHCEDESAHVQTMFAFARQFTSGDQDVYAQIAARDLGYKKTIYADVSAEWSALLPDVTFVGGADRWVIGFWRHSASEDRVRAYVHDRDNLVFNSGIVASNHNPSGEHATFPALGGRSHPTDGTTALMVYRADPFFGNSTTSVIQGVGIDAQAGLFTNQRVRVSRLDLDAESPDVNCQIGWGDDGWIVAYQARTGPIDDYDVYAARISTSFGFMSDAQLGPDGLGDKARPVVQGWDGRYMVAMLQDITPETNGQYFGRNVRVERFDWRNGATQPTRQESKVALSRPAQEISNLDLGFDGVSYSHWCLVAEVAGPRCVVRRLGFSGAVTESADLDGGAAGRYHPAVGWNAQQREFPIVYCATHANVAIFGQRLQYPTNAWNLVYGSGCGPAVIGTDTQPYAGSEFYRVQLTGAPPAQPAVLLVGTAAAAFELSALGAPNCFFNLASAPIALPFSTGGVGAVTFTTPLRDAPLVRGDVYWQFAYGWPARPHALPIGLTAGLRAHIQ